MGESRQRNRQHFLALLQLSRGGGRANNEVGESELRKASASHGGGLLFLKNEGPCLGRARGGAAELLGRQLAAASSWQLRLSGLHLLSS